MTQLIFYLTSWR